MTRVAPPGPMVTLLGLREVVQFPFTVAVTADATQVIVGSSATAVGIVPRRPMHLVSVQCAGHCSAAANAPELNLGVFKNLIPTGRPTPNTTNRAMVAQKSVAAATGYNFGTAAVVDAGMDAFDGAGDFWTLGAWATGATGTCTLALSIRLEFLID